jgi:hypothetical protein
MNVHVFSVHDESHSPLLNNLISSQKAKCKGILLCRVTRWVLGGYADSMEIEAAYCMLVDGLGRPMEDLNWKEGCLLQTHHGIGFIESQRRDGG